MKDSESVEIGMRLRAERKRLKLTQTAMGKIGGVSSSSQCAYEAGTHCPNVDYVQRVVAAGVDFNYFVLGTRGQTSIPDDEGAVLVTIIDAINEWGECLPVRLSLKTRTHLLGMFYEQYQGTGVLDI